MIKVTVQYNDHLVDIHFPCSENTLQSALMEIHAADDIARRTNRRYGVEKSTCRFLQ